MGIKRWAAGILARNVARKIYREAAQAVESQEKTFRDLLSRAAGTQFGREHAFASIRSHADFCKAVPVRDYEQAKRFFDMIYQGVPDVCWPGKPLYLAKTSGTTSGSKYIPITRESIRFQIKAARDALLLYIHHTGKSQFLDGKMIFLSGSPEVEPNAHGIPVGRLSGIVNHFVPGYLTKNRMPSYATNCIEEWEEKVDAIVQETKDADMRLISGIPPWVQMYFERLEAMTGKKPLEQWPNLHLFVQGGVEFAPYRGIFDPYFKDKVDVLEVFPASEGFFAIQDKPNGEGLLLNLGHGIFYEFIPLEEYGKENARRLTLGQVELGVQYALVVSTNAGLWAYDIGDTVKFVSLDPPRIKVSGRVKHFISAFGEHVIGEEVSQAMVLACAEHGCEVREFTVAPMVLEKKGDSYHEWLVEFETLPANLDAFAHFLDFQVRKLNAYYDDLREGGMLRNAVVTPLVLNASREYMKSVGKLGGQNKFPKLSNNRSIADQLYPYIRRF